jgi:peptidoglycan/xylan/chitin deacetylase (PgdA/CDA1 family)
MKKYLLGSIYFVAYHIGIFDLLYRFYRRPIVVSYHNIIPDSLGASYEQFIGGDHLESEFDQHLEIIKSKLPVGNEIAPGKVLITFDDGYRNNYLVAAKLLKKHEVKATFFVPACYFDSPEILWVDKMLMWLSFVPAGEYQLGGTVYPIGTGNDRSRAWTGIWQSLLNDFALKEQILEDMKTAHDFPDLPMDSEYRKLRFEVLSEVEMEELKTSGNKIGCHSYQHDILAKLAPEELSENFSRCATHAEKYNTRWFSYPFGRESEVSEQVVSQCRDFGYSQAFMNIADSNPNDEFRIPRINMPNSASKTLIHAKLSGFEDLLKRVLRL